MPDVVQLVLLILLVVLLTSGFITLLWKVGEKTGADWTEEPPDWDDEEETEDPETAGDEPPDGEEWEAGYDCGFVNGLRYAVQVEEMDLGQRPRPLERKSQIWQQAFIEQVYGPDWRKIRIPCRDDPDDEGEDEDEEEEADRGEDGTEADLHGTHW